MGMGKTTVSLMFKKNGIKVWNADLEVHKLYENGNEGYKNIISILEEVCPEFTECFDIIGTFECRIGNLSLPKKSRI